MTDWRNVACMDCGWRQQHPHLKSIFMYKCDKCGCGSCVHADETIAAPPDKEVPKESPAKESVPDWRSTATLDLDKLTRFELIEIINILLKDRHDFK